MGILFQLAKLEGRNRELEGGKKVNKKLSDTGVIYPEPTKDKEDLHWVLHIHYLFTSK